MFGNQWDQWNQWSQWNAWNQWNELLQGQEHEEDAEVAEAVPDRDKQGVRRTRRIVVDRTNPFTSMSDDAFVSRFRLKKDSVNTIIKEVRDHLPAALDKRGCPVPAHLQVLITLACMASGSHQGVIGDCYDVSQTKVSQCLATVAKAIAELSKQYIKLPTGDAVNIVMDEFSAIAGMPGVLGCIDCTHFRILKPNRDDSKVYRCSKGFFSLNIQGICGPDLSFYDIVAWPGSIDDSKIFYSSKVHDLLEEGSLSGHLLGDTGYPCKKYLLTPLVSPDGPQEEAFNKSHKQTRNTIKKAFGVLKRRFAYLGTIMRTNLDTTQAIIVASAVLHNIAIQTRLDIAEDLKDLDQENAAINIGDDDACQSNSISVEDGVKRDQIIRDHF